MRVLLVEDEPLLADFVAKGLREGSVRGNESLPATMTLEVAGLKLKVSFDGEINLA